MKTLTSLGGCRDAVFADAANRKALVFIDEKILLRNISDILRNSHYPVTGHSLGRHEDTDKFEMEKESTCGYTGFWRGSCSGYIS